MRSAPDSWRYPCRERQRHNNIQRHIRKYEDQCVLEGLDEVRITCEQSDKVRDACRRWRSSRRPHREGDHNRSDDRPQCEDRKAAEARRKEASRSTSVATSPAVLRSNPAATPIAFLGALHYVERHAGSLR